MNGADLYNLLFIRKSRIRCYQCDGTMRHAHYFMSPSVMTSLGLLVIDLYVL
jgi:hypothetical protein